MKRSLIIAVVAVLVAVAAVAQEPLPQVFSRMKSEFANGDYKKSLADVEILDQATQKPGFERDRAQLAAPISFYRAANLASLGRRSEAQDEFANFLLLSPNADIKSPPFSKQVVDAFQAAQKLAAGRNNTLATSYAAFVVPAGWTLPADANWPLSPVRFLLSNDEKKAYAALETQAERDAFVANFWKAYDPTPDTPANEFRTEFERRVAFADQNFGSTKVAGPQSDRALVFVFWGPPTFATRSAIGAGDDAISSLRGNAPGANMPTAATDRSAGSAGRGASMYDIERPDRLGTRESWYYRQGRIPVRVPFQEIRFDFLTKEGYGDAVLEKDPKILQSLGISSENARKDKKLN